LSDLPTNIILELMKVWFIGISRGNACRPEIFRR
jgi:hypothetical protein